MSHVPSCRGPGGPVYLYDESHGRQIDTKENNLSQPDEPGAAFDSSQRFQLVRLITISGCRATCKTNRARRRATASSPAARVPDHRGSGLPEKAAHTGLPMGEPDRPSSGAQGCPDPGARVSAVR